eukprot:Pompholyxophrys_sp_v1_NODE_127_length_1708_cov_39.354507.p3 type:complete len:111 gc:universal NODE_127_length_1708_cov_39.354507:981-649(-)
MRMRGEISGALKSIVMKKSVMKFWTFWSKVSGGFGQFSIKGPIVCRPAQRLSRKVSKWQELFSHVRVILTVPLTGSMKSSFNGEGRFATASSRRRSKKLLRTFDLLLADR